MPLTSNGVDTTQKKVLVVEDDADMANILVDNLSKFNFKLFHAGDGEEAIKLILDERPHLIILDLLLPKLDGFKVLERLRHYPDQEIAKTKVIVLSNLSSNKDILSIQALKVEEYYVKSTTKMQDVYAKARHILEALPI